MATVRALAGIHSWPTAFCAAILPSDTRDLANLFLHHGDDIEDDLAAAVDRLQSLLTHLGSLVLGNVTPTVRHECEMTLQGSHAGPDLALLGETWTSATR